MRPGLRRFVIGAVCVVVTAAVGADAVRRLDFGPPRTGPSPEEEAAARQRILIQYELSRQNFRKLTPRQERQLGEYLSTGNVKELRPGETIFGAAGPQPGPVLPP